MPTSAKAAEPFNLAFLDLDKLIRDENLMEVTSEFIKEPSSNHFHHEGLFSEEIFGQIGSETRLKRGAYIKLNCHVLHPIVFQNLQAVRRFYIEIISGNSYAVWDNEDKDFKRASADERGADTGFTFFMKHFNQLDLTKSSSLKRNDRIDVIMKYKNLRIIDKIYVIPAAVRDMKEEDTRMEKDSINKLYTGLLRNAKAMTPGSDTNALFDAVHYLIQRRVVELYDFVANLMSGKRGFMEGKYQHRSIARGTRNVITASDMDCETPDAPNAHRIDETKVPLFQAAKGGANFMVYMFKSLFYDQIVSISSENVPLISPKTLNLEYVPLSGKDKDRMMTAEGIERTIDRFRDTANRFNPVTADGPNDKKYYLFMVYDEGDRVYITRNVGEFKQRYEQAGKKYDPEKMRPLTNVEMLYIVAYHALKGTHATVTRYPVTDDQSIYVSRTHIMTTSPSRIVRMCQDVKDSEGDIVLPEYPVNGARFVDAVMLHPTRLKSLAADFDGDTVSWIPIFSEEANAECSKYLHSASNYILPSGNTLARMADDIVSMTIHALTRDVPDLQKKPA